jgi:hypothetical protein
LPSRVVAGVRLVIVNKQRAMASRYELPPAQGRTTEGTLPAQAGDRGRTAADNRPSWRQVGAAERRALEAPARALRQLEECAQAAYPLGRGGDVGADLYHADAGPEAPIAADRRSAVGISTRGRKHGHTHEAIGHWHGGLRRCRLPVRRAPHYQLLAVSIAEAPTCHQEYFASGVAVEAHHADRNIAVDRPASRDPMG